MMFFPVYYEHRLVSCAISLLTLLLGHGYNGAVRRNATIKLASACIQARLGRTASRTFPVAHSAARIPEKG